MLQRVTCTLFLFLSLIASAASAQAAAPSKQHLFMFKTEQSARARCPNDRIVWVNTTSHTLHLPGDHHVAHTHGGFACESEARARGYRGPTAHT
jgi:hypothetical protein